MQADAALFHKSPLEIVLFGAFNLVLILSVAWFGTRSRPGDFRLSRVIGLTVMCLATSLPFWWLAYSLWPWDFQSKPVRATISVAFFAPLATAFTLVLIKKREKLPKNEITERVGRTSA